MLPFFAEAQTGVLTLNVKYKKMGIDDRIDVVYKYSYKTTTDSANIQADEWLVGDSTAYANIDTAKQKLPDATYNVRFDDFYMLEGAKRTKKSTIKLSGKRYVHTGSLTLTYNFKPRKLGVLTIPAMVLKLDSVVYRQTKPVLITVVKGSIIPGPGSRRRTLEKDAATISMALKKAPGKYLVSTGPFFRLPADSVAVESMLDLLAERTNMISRSTDLGNYYWNGIPRRYMIINDTAWVRKSLDIEYPNYKETDFSTCFFPADNWKATTELTALKSKQHEATRPQKDYIERKP
ncbi:hypothetical protein CJD36_010320 [Flavipsychrobacter stenotrophus]|uniref:Uncharacterized protein n=1 Tax=Flavipsychrobacter stenotrophus TaxID=2077091 RepID=A0A2S7STY5_9BACT|nr:hypothetical protein CJD36_010320 [Flavipsychrobacter stenotrophus]